MELDADGLFKKLLRDLRPLFKENGFQAASQNFVCESDECWAVINFQKSYYSNRGEKTFYVNVAVTAKRILGFQERPPTKAPPFYVCDWRWRAEQLGPSDGISSWTIKDEETAEKALNHLSQLFSAHVIPAVKELLSESALIAKAGSNPGYPQGKAVSILLAANARTDQLKQQSATYWSISAEAS
jgi:hypothetical protein